MNVIFTVNLPETKKPGRTIPYHYSIESWKHYALRHNAEIFVLEDRVYPEEYMNANWHKIFSLKLLEANGIDYDSVLIVDGDTIVHPNAPSIFDECTGGFCAVHNDGSYDWMLRSMEVYSQEVFNGFTFPFTQYFNSGVLVINKSQAGFLDYAIQFYNLNRERLQGIQSKYGVGTDQPVLNYLVQQKIPEQLQILPYKWNMQELPRREVLDLELTFVNYGWVYHFNGIHPDFKPNMHNIDSAVEQWMRYVYEKLYQ